MVLKFLRFFRVIVSTIYKNVFFIWLFMLLLRETGINTTIMAMSLLTLINQSIGRAEVEDHLHQFILLTLRTLEYLCINHGDQSVVFRFEIIMLS